MDQLIEFQRPERIELGPQGGHPPGIQTVVLEFSLSSAGDEPQAGKHAEVLRDRRPAHGEVTGQLGHRLLTVPQQLQQAAATGLRDRNYQVGHVNTLVATRLLRKGYETTILLYGPGVTLGFQRGFPTLGDEAFPGHLFVNQRLAKFMEEGGKVYSCRFSTQALYGQTEKAFIPGIIPINPLDVLDCILVHKKAGATIIDTWTV